MVTKEKAKTLVEHLNEQLAVLGLNPIIMSHIEVSSDLKTVIWTDNSNPNMMLLIEALSLFMNLQYKVKCDKLLRDIRILCLS